MELLGVAYVQTISARMSIINGITAWIECQLRGTHRRYRRRDCDVCPEPRKGPHGLIGFYGEDTYLYLTRF